MTDEVKKEIQFADGRIDYVVFGNRTSPPILVVPGFGGHLLDFSKDLHKESKLRVINSGLVDLKLHEQLDPTEWMITKQARALIEIIKAEGLSKTPVFLVGHSMGAIVISKAVELAVAEHMTCFDYEKGSRAVFLAPAGSISGRFVVGADMGLAKRFIEDQLIDALAVTIGELPKFEDLGLPKFLKPFFEKISPHKLEKAIHKAILEINEIDPHGDSLKRVIEHLRQDVIVTIREAIELLFIQIEYEKINQLGLRPKIFVYANDGVFPQDLYDFEKLEKHAEGIAIPNMGLGSIDPSSPKHPAVHGHLAPEQTHTKVATIKAVASYLSTKSKYTD